MRIYYCDHFELPLPEGHRFPIAKYKLTRERVQEELGTKVELCVASAATEDQLLRVHAASYVRDVFAGTLSNLAQKRIGFPWSPKMLERSLRSTGATVEAAMSARLDGLAVHLSGGTHHAFADEGQGFCVFNDVAVAAAQLRSLAGIQNILIVDLDVHQGNGTASIFARTPEVFTFSMHGDKNYPFRKTSGDLDIAMPDGTNDTQYLEALEQAFDHQLPLESVQFAFYIAGADPFANDRMGRLSLTIPGLHERDRLVLSRLRQAGIPVAVVMGGGYADVDEVAAIHSGTATIAYEFYQSHPPN